MKKLFSLFVSVLILSIFLAACSNQETEQQPATEQPSEENVQQLELYTTIFPLEDFARKIGGDYVNVTNLVPVGADAHSFEPTAREMISVAEGDAFIYNGAGLEGFVDALIDTIEGEEVQIVKASEGMELIDFDAEQNHTDDEHEEEHDQAHGENEHEEESHDHAEEADAQEEEDHGHAEEADAQEEEDHDHAEEAHAQEEEDHGHAEEADAQEEEDHDHAEEAHAQEEEDHGHDEQAHDHDKDPHVWLDPIRSITLAENIKNTLIELLPEQEEYFTFNFEEVKAELEAIDREFQAMVDAAGKDTFLVSHAGYGYWEARYGVKQIGIAGISPTNEPSQRQLQDLIGFANEYDLEYVMFEQNVPAKVADVVRDEVGAEALYLHNLEALVEEDIQNEEDYFSLMRKNIEALATALQ
ncbi:metal ABC transporter solute-binding protein, Zn/Mn family [Alkalihalobacillus deserti]|uniref:metal ABC transporter solute-binding protein, Zn/Mn family n=1 Tax=Alkalihalobacillus deserti TaxID=2879466 RepID=UPI001D13FBCA|nr:zinc ABC transporter substrate-binding protein [Alkalihalobacillus deserti]